MATRHYFNPDRPKRDPTDDKLDIDPFIRRLVGPLLYAPEDSSLVVGLFGQWGLGKSTALNFLEVALRQTKSRQTGRGLGEKQAVVVRFTPWLYSSVETLLPAFFETLASEIGGMSSMTTEERSKLKSALVGIGHFIGPAIKLGVSTFGGPMAGNIAGALADAATGTSKAAAELVGEAQFEARKSEAAEVLRSLGKQGIPLRVVVLIDDLDRVAGGNEVLAMLKLVKLVADLPNVSYVIAMDRDRVQSLLKEEESSAFRSSFLDKIIQVPISLPSVYPERLSKILVEEAIIIARTAGLDPSPLAVEWDKWEILRRNAYETRIRPALRTLRDVTRILNVYRFAALMGDTQSELHAVDLLLVSILQVTAPAVYEKLPRNRDFLLHSDKLSEAWKTSGDQEKARDARNECLREIAGVYDEPGRRMDGGVTAQDRRRDEESAFPILEFLFPHAVSSRLEGNELQKARNEGRIHTEDHFDSYFRLQPLEGSASRTEASALFGQLLKAGDDAVPGEWGMNLRERVSGLSDSERQSLFSRLDDRASQMTLDEARKMTGALPVVAQRLGSIASDQIVGIAAHTYKVLSSFRENEEAQSFDIRSGVRMLAAVVLNLPAREGAEFAYRLANEKHALIVLPDQDVLEIARTGLQRSAELFASNQNVFEQLHPFEAAEAVWTWRHLAVRANESSTEESYAPLELYLNRIVDKREFVSDVVSLAAAWGNGPSLKTRTFGDIEMVLTRFLRDFERLLTVCRDLAAEPNIPGRWPHLIGELLELEAKEKKLR